MLAAGLSRFRINISDSGYPGVSGYGEGAVMSLRDYSKFLRAVIRKGVGANGRRIFGETTWKSLMSATINDDETMGFIGPQSRYALVHIMGTFLLLLSFSFDVEVAER